MHWRRWFCCSASQPRAQGIRRRASTLEAARRPLKESSGASSVRTTRRSSARWCIPRRWMNPPRRLRSWESSRTRRGATPGHWARAIHALRGGRGLQGSDRACNGEIRRRRHAGLQAATGAVEHRRHRTPIGPACTQVGPKTIFRAAAGRQSGQSARPPRPPILSRHSVPRRMLSAAAGQRPPCPAVIVRPVAALRSQRQERRASRVSDNGTVSSQPLDERPGVAAVSRDRRVVDRLAVPR